MRPFLLLCYWVFYYIVCYPATQRKDGKLQMNMAYSQCRGGDLPTMRRLADQIGEWLSANATGVREIYLYGSTVKGADHPDDLDMGVLVRRPRFWRYCREVAKRWSGTADDQPSCIYQYAAFAALGIDVQEFAKALELSTNELFDLLDFHIFVGNWRRRARRRTNMLDDLEKDVAPYALSYRPGVGFFPAATS